jgi:hypothetical protein
MGRDPPFGVAAADRGELVGKSILAVGSGGVIGGEGRAWTDGAAAPPGPLDA